MSEPTASRHPLLFYALVLILLSPPLYVLTAPIIDWLAYRHIDNPTAQQAIDIYLTPFEAMEESDMIFRYSMEMNAYLNRTFR